MTPTDHDDPLRARFRALRAAEARAAPAFEALLDRAPRASSARPALAFPAAALAFVAAVLALRPAPEPAVDVAALAVATSLPGAMPSDFLLSPEGRDIRRAPPRVIRRANAEVPFL